MFVAGAGAWCGADGEVLMADAREQRGPRPCWHCTPGRTHTGHWGAGGSADIPGGGITPPCCRVHPGPGANDGVFLV